MIASGVTLAALPARAEAQAPRSTVTRLVYTAPTSCPSEQVLRDLVAGQTSVKVFVKKSQNRLDVTLTQHGALYEAIVTLRDATGGLIWTRPFLPASSCSDLVEDVAVYVSTKLERGPMRTSSAEASAPGGTPPLCLPVERHPPTIDPLVFTLGLGSAIAFGAEPHPSFGLNADVGVHWALDAKPLEGFSISLGVRWEAPNGSPVRGLPITDLISVTETARLLLWTLAPCAHAGKLYACAIGEVGRLQTHLLPKEIDGIANPSYALAGGRVGFEVPFSSHVGFRAYGEFLGNLQKRRITATSEDGTATVVVWRMPPVSGGFGVGLYAFF